MPGTPASRAHARGGGRGRGGRNPHARARALRPARGDAMSLDADTLYDLLPAVYRVRDAQLGEPLRALLGVIARELGALEQDLEQLYHDQFIETCADWVAPY